MLEAAAAAIEAGRDVQALSILVAAWRERRAPEIAALAELVDRRQAVARLPDSDAGEIAFEDLGVVLGSIDLRRPPRALECLSRVRDRDDPRLASFVLRLLEDPPFPQKATTQKLWQLIFAITARLADPRVLAAADSLGATFAGKFRDSYVTGRLRKTIAEISRRYSNGVPTLSPHEVAVIERARTRLAGRGSRDDRAGDDLLAEIRANPDDDAPRLVYADWLTERADPRGELIALQIAATSRELTRVESGRVRGLLDDHAIGWLGPIATLVGRGSVRFARGFLDEVELTSARRTAAIGPDPRWSTVTRVLVSDRTATRALIQFGALGNLRRFEGILSISDLQILVQRRNVFSRLEAIRIELSDLNGSTIDTLVSLRGLPALQRIRLSGLPESRMRALLVGTPAMAPIVELGDDCLIRNAHGTLA